MALLNQNKPKSQCSYCNGYFDEYLLYGLQCEACFIEQHNDMPFLKRVQELELEVRGLRMSMRNHSHLDNMRF